MTAEEVTKLTEALQRAKAELLVIQTYQLKEGKGNVKPGSDGAGAFVKTLKLSNKIKIDNEAFDTSRPENVKVTGVSGGVVHLKLARNHEQERALFRNYFEDATSYRALLQKKGREQEVLCR